MVQNTCCDGVLVARGAMGNPWIVEDILRHREGLPAIHRGATSIREALLEHFSLIIQYQPERRALLDMRRVGCWYLKRLKGVKTLRVQINRASSTQQALQHIQEFPWADVEISSEPSVVGA